MLTDVQCPDGLRFGGLCDIVPLWLHITPTLFSSISSAQHGAAGGRGCCFRLAICFVPGNRRLALLPALWPATTRRTAHPSPETSFLFFFFWPHWVFIVCFFIAARARLSLAEAGGAAHYSGLSSQGTVSETVTHELSCFEACGIFPDQGSNPWPLDLQAD